MLIAMNKWQNSCAVLLRSKAARGLLQNAKKMRKPWLHRRGGPCALPAAPSCFIDKIVRRIRIICEFAEHFYVYTVAPPGGAEPPPLRTQVHIYALILIPQQTPFYNHYKRGGMKARLPSALFLETSTEILRLTLARSG